MRMNNEESHSRATKMNLSHHQESAYRNRMLEAGIKFQSFLIQIPDIWS